MVTETGRSRLCFGGLQYKYGAMSKEKDGLQGVERGFGGMVVRYGILTGVILSVFLVIRWLVSMPAEAPMGFAECGVVFVVCALGFWRFKCSVGGREAGFWRRFSFVWLVAIVGLMVYSAFMYIYIIGIDAEMQQRCLDLQRRQQANGGLSEERLMEMVRPSYIAFSVALIGGVFSAVWAAVLAFFFRKGKSFGCKEAEADCE